VIIPSNQDAPSAYVGRTSAKPVANLLFLQDKDGYTSVGGRTDKCGDDKCGDSLPIAALSIARLPGSCGAVENRCRG